MAVNVTRWSPDTCGCVLEYSWDDSIDPAFRVHTPVSHDASACTVHAPPVTVAAGYARVNDENTRKNKANAAAAQWAAANGLSALVVFDADGTPSHLVDGAFSWAYDPTGLLTITLSSQVSAAQKQAIQTVLTNRFGAGKIKVV